MTQSDIAQLAGLSISKQNSTVGIDATSITTYHVSRLSLAGQHLNPNLVELSFGSKGGGTSIGMAPFVAPITGYYVEPSID